MSYSLESRVALLGLTLHRGAAALSTADQIFHLSNGMSHGSKPSKLYAEDLNDLRCLNPQTDALEAKRCFLEQLATVSSSIVKGNDREVPQPASQSSLAVALVLEL